MHRHFETWIGARARRRLGLEHPVIKRGMLFLDRDQAVVGLKILGTQHRKTQRDIGQHTQAPRPFGVGRKAAWINESLARIDARVDDIAKYTATRCDRMLLVQVMQPKRADQLLAIKYPEAI